EVRHLRHFLDFSEKLPYALATRKRLRHRSLSFVVQREFTWHRDDSPKSRYPSRLSGQAYGCPSSRRFGQPNRRPAPRGQIPAKPRPFQRPPKSGLFLKPTVVLPALLRAR